MPTEVEPWLQFSVHHNPCLAVICEVSDSSDDLDGVARTTRAEDVSTTIGNAFFLS
jgi:hypothetical protein